MLPLCVGLVHPSPFRALPFSSVLSVSWLPLPVCVCMPPVSVPSIACYVSLTVSPVRAFSTRPLSITLPLARENAHVCLHACFASRFHVRAPQRLRPTTTATATTRLRRRRRRQRPAVLGSIESVCGRLDLITPHRRRLCTRCCPK